MFFTEIKLRGSSEAITTYLLLRRTSTSHTQVRLAAASTGTTRELRAWPYFVPCLTLAPVQIFVKAGNFVEITKTKRFGRRPRIFHINPLLQNEIYRFEGNARLQNGISFSKASSNDASATLGRRFEKGPPSDITRTWFAQLLLPPNSQERRGRKGRRKGRRRRRRSKRK